MVIVRYFVYHLAMNACTNSSKSRCPCFLGSRILMNDSQRSLCNSCGLIRPSSRKDCLMSNASMYLSWSLSIHLIESTISSSNSSSSNFLPISSKNSVKLIVLEPSMSYYAIIFLISSSDGFIFKSYITCLSSLTSMSPLPSVSNMSNTS